MILVPPLGGIPSLSEVSQCAGALESNGIVVRTVCWILHELAPCLDRIPAQVSDLCAGF